MLVGPELRDTVREAYSAAAMRPADPHPFPVGRRFAESLGYPGGVLDRLPATSVDAFSGVSNVALFAEIRVGATVLDLGCGAGLDSIIAAERVGPEGLLIGVDFSWPMLARASRSASAVHLRNVIFCQAGAECLPLPDASLEVVLVNGIFNLNPNRAAIFRELARVIKNGGAVYGAELVLREPLPVEKKSAANWFA